MKRLVMLMVSLSLVFVLSACLTGGTGRDEVAEVDIPTELPTEQVNLVFWHAWGEDNQGRVDDMFESFQAEYPELNVSLTQTGQGDYDTLRESLIHAIAAGATPTMMTGYPDHFAGYLNGNALVPLDDYIAHEDYGINLDDFIQGYIDENAQFDNQYSMPLSKSTEMVVYNKDVFDHHGIDIPSDRAITWDDLEDWRDVIVGSGDMQTEYLFNVDSGANFYINSARHWGAGYTNTDGEILIGEDDGKTEEMLSYFQDRFEDNTLVFPSAEDLNYGNELLHKGLVAMTQGSTAGMSYNITTESRTEDGKFGMFEIGVAPAVQKVTCELGVDATNPSDNCAAMQQGPNVAVSADATEAERLVAWLFIKHMTNTENTASFAMDTGYIPVRQSAFESDDYQDFLDIEYDPDGDNTDYYFSQAAHAAYAQINYYRFDPAFTGNVTSSRARSEVELAMESLFAGDSVDQVVDRLKSRLS